MSRNGSGIYTLNTAGQPVVAGTTIAATAFNAATTDIATALTQSICVDGQSVITGNIPFAGFKATGLGVGTATGDALSYGRAATVAAFTATGVAIFDQSATTQAFVTIKSSPSALNWQITSNNYITSGLEFTPSTAAGGTTFTTPLWVMDGANTRIYVNGSTVIGSSEKFGVRGGTGVATMSQTTANASYVSQFWNSDTTGNNLFCGFYTEAGATFRGDITYNRAGGLVAYNTSSDYRAKDLLGKYTDSGHAIDSVPVHLGVMKGATIPRPMFVAHELQETAPYAVTGEKNFVGENGQPIMQTVDHSILVPLLWAEVQSLRKRLMKAGI